MSRTIILNESQLKSFIDKKGEITRGEFKNSVLTILGKLLKNPMCKDFDDIFRRFKIDNIESLKTKLRDKGMLQKFEKISEEPNKDGKKVSYYHVSYKVPAKDLNEKIKQWFNDEIDSSNKLDECDCGGCMGGVVSTIEGATNSQSSGAFEVPLTGKPIKRTLYNHKGKKRRKGK